MNKIILALAGIAIMAACQSDKKKEEAKETTITLEEMRQKGYSLKFRMEKGDIAIYTRKGSNVRLDHIYPSGSHYVSFSARPNGERAEYSYDSDDGWQEDLYRAEQNINNFYAEGIADHSAKFCEHGYAKSGTANICGKPCDVYSGTYHEGKVRWAMYGQLARDGVQGEFAIWNGLTLRTKYADKVQSECLAIKIGDIPDEAFTQTLDVTWIE